MRRGSNPVDYKYLSGAPRVRMFQSPKLRNRFGEELEDKTWQKVNVTDIQKYTMKTADPKKKSTMLLHFFNPPPLILNFLIP